MVGGTAHTCALFSIGRIKCWGLNDKGQLGLGNSNSVGDSSNEMGNNLPFLDLPAIAKDISAGWKHTCALFEDGSVRCWGANDYGQLGQENTQTLGRSPSSVPSQIPRIKLGSWYFASKIFSNEVLL